MMGKLTALCVLLLSVLNVAVSQDTVTPVYFTDGGDLTLEVRPAFPDHINDILWIFNDNLLAEWVEDEGYNLRFKGRANLTTETGQLIINNMSKEDEGVYSVEINNRVQSERYRAKLIKKVQKPNVVLRTFTFKSMSCLFSCDSNTTEAEPVSYSWKKGDGEWKVSGRYINITSKDDPGVKNFTCRVENPVSGEESDPEHNPLYKEPEPDNPGVVVGTVLGSFFGIAFMAQVGFLVAWKEKIGPFNKGSNNITNPENGNVQPTPSGSATGPYENIPLKDHPEAPKSDAKETA